MLQTKYKVAGTDGIRHPAEVTIATAHVACEIVFRTMSLRRGLKKIRRIWSQPSSPANAPSTPEPVLPSGHPQASDLVDTSAVLPEASPSARDRGSSQPPPATSPISRPVVLSPSDPPAVEPTSHDSKPLVVDNLALAFDITEKLAGFVQTVPFIAPAAGVLGQIVKAYKVCLNSYGILRKFQYCPRK